MEELNSKTEILEELREITKEIKKELKITLAKITLLEQTLNSIIFSSENCDEQ